MYVFGGYKYEPEENYNDIHSFNSVTNEWINLQPIENNPSPRDSMSLFGFQDKLYLFGGSDQNGKILSDFHVFDLKTNSWK